jgi:hypothetical protein
MRRCRHGSSLKGDHGGGAAPTCGGFGNRERGLAAPREALRQGGAPQPAYGGGGVVRRASNGMQWMKTE